MIFTPHSAFYSVESFEEMRGKAAHEVRRVLLGEAPWNQVNGAGLSLRRVGVAHRLHEIMVGSAHPTN